MSGRRFLKEGLFKEGPNGGTLLANKCKQCGRTYFPKTQNCLKCLNPDMEEIGLSRKGKLYSYTIGHMPSMHFLPPYAIGYVDLPEGVRVFAPLVVREDKPLKIGMEMELTIERLWEEDGKDIIGYKFMPIA